MRGTPRPCRPCRAAPSPRNGWRTGCRAGGRRPARRRTGGGRASRAARWARRARPTSCTPPDPPSPSGPRPAAGTPGTACRSRRPSALRWRCCNRRPAPGAWRARAAGWDPRFGARGRTPTRAPVAGRARPRTRWCAAAFRTLQRTIGFAVVLGLLLALASAYVLARQIAGPIRRLALATRQVQDGDYSIAIEARSGDEIGMLSQAFQQLVADLKEKADLVEYMTSVSRAAPTAQLATPSPRPSVASRGDVLRPGTLFASRYEVKELLGTGGMGVVYRAFDRELQEPVAIKTLRPEALAGDGVALERFKQEIRLARRIAHRNVVRTYDLGEVNGLYYLTMEYVEGTSLKQLIGTRGRLPVPVVLTIGKQLCRALEVAHEQGVIHRDIKPQNIVVDPTGFLKVMDFGIARLATPATGKGLTQEGMSIGTPDYMSPEQLSGLELDARSDLYSAGVVLFECLTARVPFEAASVYALIAKHLEQSPPDPRTLNAEISEALANVIMKAMAKEPADRYQSAAQMHDALAAMG